MSLDYQGRNTTFDETTAVNSQIAICRGSQSAFMKRLMPS